MKKRLFVFTLMAFFYFVSSANCDENHQSLYSNNNCKSQKECENKNHQNNCENSIPKQENSEIDKSKCACENELEDDEYCTYNQCFFDKHYRYMKKNLCLTRRQENCIDNYYRNFKADMENLCEKQRAQRNKLLSAIECEQDCFKEQKSALKETKKEIKERTKDFREEVYDQLCKNQRKDFKKFYRKEARKIKKLAKYGVVYKFPCVKCCN